MNLITRKEAKVSGMIRYFTGKVCRNNHIAERYVNSGHCVQCVAQQRQEWQKAHPEKTRLSWQKYQTTNSEKCRAASLRAYYKNPECNRLWRKQNPDKVKQIQKQWRQNNPAKMAATANRRRASKIQRTPLWADKERTQSYYDVCAFFNEVNGYTKYHVDHVIPLKGKQVSGLHVHNNLQVILATENLRKGNRV